MDRFAGEGVGLDVSKDEPAKITLADVKSTEENVSTDDIVLLHTGWGEKYGTSEYDPHPWLATEAAEWFVDRDVKMVGIDTITHDLSGPKRPPGWREWPVHHILLENGILTAQHLANLGPLTGTRLDVYAFPNKIRDGDGAPVRFVARALK